MANNFRLNARKPKNNAGLATPKGEIYLLYREDIIAMPEKDKRGVLTTGDIIIKEGRRFHLLYTTPATQVHNRDTEGDVDSRGWKKKISGNYPGDELEINEFVKNNLNQGFIAVVKSCQSEFMKIYGSVNNPLYFTGSFVDDNERKGYELTFEQTFADEDPVLFYSGKILVDEDAFSESDPEFSSLFVKLDGSNITDENKEILKKKLDIGNLPPNIATIDKDDEVGNVYSKIESDANYLPKTTATITEPNTEFKYAYLTNEANETRRMLAGDLGKNVANSKPTSAAGAGLNMGAIWDIETNGFPMRIKGLPDKSADTTFSIMMVQNADGQNARSNGSNILISAMTAMSDAQKDAWRNANRKSGENYSTGQPRIDFILPIRISKGISGVQYVTCVGSNLFLNPNDMEVKLININTNAEIPISVVNTSASTTSQVSFGLNFDNVPIGSYRVSVRNGAMVNIDNETFDVVANTQGKNVSNLQWQVWKYREDLKGYIAQGNSFYRPLRRENPTEEDNKSNVFEFLSEVILTEEEANKNWVIHLSIERGKFGHADPNIHYGIAMFGITSNVDVPTGISTIDYGLRYKHATSHNYPNSKSVNSGLVTINNEVIITKKGSQIKVFQIINSSATIIGIYPIVERLKAMRILFKDASASAMYAGEYKVNGYVKSVYVEN